MHADRTNRSMLILFALLLIAAGAGPAPHRSACSGPRQNTAPCCTTRSETSTAGTGTGCGRSPRS